jgi:DNA-binding HxlR family transcriptional regulator
MSKKERLVFNCPVEAALDAMGGKWKPVILWHLNQREYRFNDLRRAIPRVTEKVLVEQLRELERSGVVSRRVIETVPPMVSYSLTQHGQTLKQAITAVSDWGLHHAATIGAEILIVDQKQEN